MESTISQDVSCEPMDVDLSTNSINISVKEESNCNRSLETGSRQKNSESVEWNIKTYHIVRDKTKITKYNNGTYFLLGLILIMLSYIVYHILDIKCSDTLDTIDLKIKLQNKVYGQPAMINSLIQSLEADVDSKILFLYGGTGVGKTFTISLAMENYWNCSNVYHFTMPSFASTFSTDTMLGLNICKSAIVVVDDLKQKDMDVKEQIANIIEKSESLNKRITVILIYNCDVISTDFGKKCDDSFYTELLQQFNDIHAYKSFIEFKPLTQEILKMCIKNELMGRTINDAELDNILNNFNVTFDGCKGVYKKIKFLNIL